MPEIARKKSPRAPSMPLDEALERALRAYEKERLHPAPSEVFAQNIGYRGANSGTALQAMASLRYFGLVERPADGLLAVTKSVEAFKFAPDESRRRALLIGFLKSPPLFAELLEKFASGLPSDANLKYELIQRGFIPPAAEATMAAFRRSVDFAGYFEPIDLPAETKDPSRDAEPQIQPQPRAVEEQLAEQVVSEPLRASARPLPPFDADSGAMDQIPVRLPGSRRAWLVIPSPFYAADKERLKAQIDLLLTEEDS